MIPLAWKQSDWKHSQIGQFYERVFGNNSLWWVIIGTNNTISIWVLPFIGHIVPAEQVIKGNVSCRVGF